MRLLVLFLFIGGFHIHASTTYFTSLDSTLNQRDSFLKKKWEKIRLINQQLKESEKKRELLYQFQATEKLCEEFQSFQYDSAFLYSTRMLQLARLLNDKEKVNKSKISISFVLLSSGMFKEALDTLQTVDPNALKQVDLVQYYKVYARTYYDLSDFSQDQHYNRIYNEQGDIYLNKSIGICDVTSSEYYFLKAWEHMRRRNIELAIETFNKLMVKFKLTEHEYAIVASSLSFMYKLNQEPEKTKEYLCKAAMADIRGSVRETVALRDLAEILYSEGNLELAFRYITISSEDASAYGAKFRKVQIAHILPLIESAERNRLERNKDRMQTFLVIASVFSILVIVFSIILVRQNRKLKQAQDKIAASNENLKHLNEKLLDANVIKEEYIGTFFKSISDYIERMEKFQNSIERKLSQKKPDEIRLILNQLNLKAEREQMYGNFDRIFLKIFPDFVTKFNALINKDEQYKLGEEELLSPELRICALIRLGITDNEKIASILSYSVNTIYTYKTRIKNKTIIPKDQLEQKIMEIKTHEPSA